MLPTLCFVQFKSQEKQASFFFFFWYFRGNVVQIAGYGSKTKDPNNERGEVNLSFDHLLQNTLDIISINLKVYFNVISPGQWLKDLIVINHVKLVQLIPLHM